MNEDDLRVELALQADILSSQVARFYNGLAFNSAMDADTRLYLTRDYQRTLLKSELLYCADATEEW